MSSATPQSKQSKRHHSSASSPEAASFSPCLVSPGRSPLQGNLTGTARKVKDSCADLHSAVQKWNTHELKGKDIISEIANIKLQAIHAKEQSTAEVETKEPVSLFPPGLEPLCSQLLQTVQTMSKVVEKMRALTNVFEGINNLEWHQFNQSFSEDPLFQTWPTNKFGENCQELLAMYEQEFRLKETIAQNVAHADTEQILMFYTASWIHEPYIEENAGLLLESMLKETGLR